MGREYFDPDFDDVRKFLDRLEGYGTRDAGGLPLGDVAGHALNRLTVCYAILEAVRLAADLGRLPPKVTFTPTGARVQDKKGTQEYPAAHLAPCNLAVGSQNTGNRTNLYELFANGVCRGYVQGLFGRTESVHRLANVADSLCERTAKGGGTADVLAECCLRLATDRDAKPAAIFRDKLVPGFQTVAGQVVVQLGQETPIEAGSGLVDRDGRAYGTGSAARSDEPSPLVDRHGRLYAERPSDTRLSSPSVEARRANLRTLLQVLRIYAGAHEPKAADILAVAGQFKALRRNEAQSLSEGSSRR